MTSQVVSDDAVERVGASPFVPVPAAVSAHATARPERPAVVDGTGRLTYAELDLRSAQLAARLVECGVGRGACVAILLDRSADFVVAALAVLRTGAAYLPLDPAGPAERLAFVLTDSGAAVVVTRAGEERLPAGPWRAVDVTERAATRAPAAVPGPDDLAYVIYTSGSTGRPKGVELTHANLAHLVAWHVVAFGITPDDRASQVASLGFDAAVWEIWPHLAAGATVLLPDEETRRSAPHLRDWLVAEAVTVAFAPTALAEQLVALPWPAGTALRTLLTGADVLHRRPPAGLPFTLVNNYGPTECTVVATSGRVAPEGAADGDVPPIGRPIADAVALVLDDVLRPVPDGEPGELCLAGPLVGRGYRNDPELTAQRFVTLVDAAGRRRFYRTGDRVRRLPDGELAFLGRLDRQVKLRGYRIEPSEIVAALDRLPGVAAAAVVARAVRGGEPELVAYVVASAPLTAAEMRAGLAARLPEYMVPAWFVGVDGLPVTAHGKLDEAALPAPSPQNVLPATDDPVPAPRSAPDDAPLGPTAGTAAVHDRVAAMVAELLKLPAVDPQENIFLAGGHSMLAMQLVSRIKQVLGVRLPLRALFEQPTVDGITATVVARLAAGEARA